MASRGETRVITTSIPDLWAWVAPDLGRRIVPFAASYLLIWSIFRPAWLGFSAGDLQAQLGFAAIAAPMGFLIAMFIRLRLARTRGELVVPGSAPIAALEGAFYVVNGPVEEMFFRGLALGGMSLFIGMPIAFMIATSAYVLYHRLGNWSWTATAATAILGVPLGLAFWLLPGPPSILGVSIVHIATTCGFLGPGPYLVSRRLRATTKD